MASLYNNKISTTYVGLIKTVDNAVINASLKELTDGSGNATGLFVNTAGDFKVTSILEWGSLKDTGEGITITKFVDEADGIASNDNDTTIPTSAAIKDYVDTKFAETDTLAEVLVFGNTTGVTKISVDSSSSGIDLVDDAKIRLGTGNDFEIYHDSATSKSIISESGASNLEIQAGNLIVKDTSDNTLSAFYAGGKNEFYFNSSKKLETTSDGVTVTGGLTATGSSVFTGATFSSNVSWADSAKAIFGDGTDLEVFHNGTSYIQNNTGILRIIQNEDDGDIQFESDDGSGGLDTYFYLDGSGTRTIFEKLTRHNDSVNANFGTDSDLRIYHDSNNSYIEQSGTGDLIIQQKVDDKDIIFKSDDGSGGVTEYFRVDGGIAETVFSKNTVHSDSVKAVFGTGGDLEIYHDGSSSYITDAGTGDLVITASNDLWIQTGTGTAINTNDSGSVDLYYDNSKKFETTNTGVTVTGAATLSGGALIMDSDWAIQLGSTNATIEGNSSGTVLRFNASDYFKWTDGGTTRMTLDASGNLELYDNQKIKLGTSSDLEIYHDGSHSYIEDTGTGDLRIKSNGASIAMLGNSNEDMILAIPNGAVNLYYDNSKKFETTSGGTTTTGNATVTSNVLVGAAGSYFGENTLRFKSAGAGYIDHNTTSQNIIFRTSNSSSLDVTALTISANGDLSTGRDVTIAGDLTVNGTTTTVNTDHFNVEDPLISMAKDNAANSVDIGTYGRYNDGTQRYLGLFSDASDSNTWKLFKGLTVEPTTTVDTTATGYELADLDAGTGTFTGTLNVSTSNPMFNLQESGTSRFRAELGSNHSYLSTIGSYNLYLRTNQTTAITLDTSQNATFAQNIYLADAKKIVCGLSDDLQLYHSGGAGGSYLENYAGNLYITNYANDADIIFTNDDGTGSTAEYFRVDGSSEQVIYAKGLLLNDNVHLKVGAGGDLDIYHDGTATYLRNMEGTFYIKQDKQDGNLIFQCDDGSGGVADYFLLDGGSADGTNLYTKFPDNSRLIFGTGEDLQIYHNGTDSYIRDNGTGSLKVCAENWHLMNAAATEFMMTATPNAEVALYYDNATKFLTTSTGIKVHSNGVDAIIQLKADGGTADISTWEMRAVGVAGEGLLFRQVNDASSVYTNRMILDTDGFLGLGTITPEVALDVEGASNLTSRIRVTKTTGKTLEIGADRGTTDAPYIASITNHNLDFLTNDTLALTLDTSQDATFAGKVYVNETGGESIVIANNGYYGSKDTGGTEIRLLGINNGDAIYMGSIDGSSEVYIRSAGADAISIDGSQNTTFAGNVIIHDGSNAPYIDFVENADTGDSKARITMDQVDTNNGQLIFSTENAGTLTTALTINQTQNATFVGTVTCSGGAASNNDSANALIVTGTEHIRAIVDTSSTGGHRASYILESNGNEVGIETTGSGEMILQTGTTTALTIDSSQDATFAGDVEIGDYFKMGSAAEYMGVFGFNRNTTSGAIYNSSYGGYQLQNYQGALQLQVYSSVGGLTTTHTFSNDGDFFIASSSFSSSTRVKMFEINPSCIATKSAASATTLQYHNEFHNSNGMVGSISTSGTATAFTTSSDYRLKDDLQDFNGLDMVSKIPVYDFKWKTDESRSYGVMAHELQEVLPNAVTGEKDAEEMQGVDYSKIVPLLVKSIQELKAEIDELKKK